MPSSDSPPRLRIRVVFTDHAWLGPGKADLLEGIGATGSIAAAGRHLGMSYKRAWSLVETLNATFAEPLIESSRGGARHGGARLTKAGARVLALYRGIETHASQSGAAEMAALQAMLATPDASTDMSAEK
ncbi:MAG: LysR family transcriptional regulator [Hyphomicrobiaceae bacterium]|nr:LysR family transcriptional regulator [Hyphomicrobiaceae bacterium]